MQDEDGNLKTATLEELQSNVGYINDRIDDLINRTEDRLSILSERIWDTKRFDENRFWILVWSLVATVLSVLILSVFLNVYFEKVAVLEMVKRGENPIAARCAFRDQYEEAVCLTYLTKVVK